MVFVNMTLKEKLLSNGISFLWQGDFNLPLDCSFEAPCSIKWMAIEDSLYLGAFSYAVSGYYFATRIGRFTSIGEMVQVGRGNHPTNWFSSAPIFYEDFDSIYNNVDQSQIKNADLGNITKESFYYSAPPSLVKPVVIGNDVWIGHGAFILPGITIGDGAIIGAHSTVTKDVPPYSIVVGNPARIVKYRFPDEIIRRFLQLKWWNYTIGSIGGIPIDNVQESLDIIESRIENGLCELYYPKLVKLEEIL